MSTNDYKDSYDYYQMGHKPNGLVPSGYHHGKWDTTTGTGYHHGKWDTTTGGHADIYWSQNGTQYTPFTFDIRPTFVGIVINGVGIDWGLLRKLGPRAALLWAALRMKHTPGILDFEAFAKINKKYLNTMNNTAQKSTIYTATSMSTAGNQFKILQEQLKMVSQELEGFKEPNKKKENKYENSASS